MTKVVTLGARSSLDCDEPPLDDGLQTRSRTVSGFLRTVFNPNDLSALECFLYFLELLSLIEGNAVSVLRREYFA